MAGKRLRGAIDVQTAVIEGLSVATGSPSAIAGAQAS
ncbi:hypothetical protein JOD46_002567 [Agromyces aurantiacus]|nr:hypothetical protein [Agromyces aurantiacus]